MFGPRRAATEDVRDDIASSAGGEKPPRREAKRGGVTIVSPPGPRIAALVKPVAKAPDGTRALRSSSKLEVRRQARLHLDGSFGKRQEAPNLFSRASATVSRTRVTARRKAFRGTNVHREADSPLVLGKRVGCRSR